MSLGTDTFLSMLLTHNFVHTDLHPGNIMVRVVDASGRVVPRDLLASTRTDTAGNTHAPAGTHAHGGGSGPSVQQQPPGALPEERHYGSSRTQLVLLDFGLAEELTPRIRMHFISFITAVAAGHGARAAHHLLQWGEHQRCPDPVAFTEDVIRLFDTHCNIHSAGGVDLDLVMKQVLSVCRKHCVTIDSGYASLAIAVCVLMGFATSLDDQVNIIDAAAPALLYFCLSGRLMGRLYG